MRTASKVAFGLLMWAAVASAQCTNPTQIPNQTIGSGSQSFSDNNALTASSVTINGSASVTFNAHNCIDLKPGFRATAGTATTTFHAWVDLAPGVPSITPNGGSGVSQTFTIQVSGTPDYTHVGNVFALFNSTFNGANACYVQYNASANLLYLANDAGSDWLGGFVPGSSSTASNAACTINGAGSSVSTAGAQLTANVAVTFQPGFAGTKAIYLMADDGAGLSSGWRQGPDWVVPAQYYLTTSVAGGGSISPASGWYASGSAVPVSATASSGYGFAGFSGSLSGSGTPQNVTMNTAKTVTANFVAAPVLSPGPGTYSPSANVAITSGTAGALIRYTTDGSTPSATVGTAYSGAVSIGVTSTLKAFAYLNGLGGGAATSGAYTIVAETISTPDAPSGRATVSLNTASTFTSGNAASNVGHVVEYQFDWGDGTQSAWSGTASASHAWSGAGAKNVTVKARCVAHPGVVSAVSGAWVVNVVVPDFQISFPADPVTIDPSLTRSPVNLQVSFTRINGFNQDVSLSATVTGNGSAQLSATVLYGSSAASGTSVLMAPAAGADGRWLPGIYDVTVTAQSGSLVHTAVARTMVATGPDFTLTVTPRASTVLVGQTAYYDVVVNGVNGFGSAVDLTMSAGGLSGVTITPGSLTAQVGQTFSFGVATTGATASGSFSMTGSGGGRIHTHPVALNVGSVNTYTVSGTVMQPDGSPMSGVTLSVSGNPSLTTVSDGNGNYSVALPVGSYTVVPTGTSGLAVSRTYASLAGNQSGQNFRLRTISLLEAPPDDTPPQGPAVRPTLYIYTGQRATYPWKIYGDSSANAQNDITGSATDTGCWVQPRPGVDATYNRPASPGPEYSITFDVQADATPGVREVYCRYRGRATSGWWTVTVVQRTDAMTLDIVDQDDPRNITPQRSSAGMPVVYGGSQSSTSDKMTLTPTAGFADTVSYRWSVSGPTAASTPHLRRRPS